MHQHAHNDHQENVTPQQRIAVLRYMLEHNRHHAEELHEISHQTEGEASELIHEAVECFERSNEKLEKALAILETV